jgi:hypothetical protein
MAEQWLYRSADLILGPVPPAQIIEKIYAGELDGKSEVQLMGSGSFRRLIEIEQFKVHLAKSDVKRKVDRMAEAHASVAKKKRNMMLIVTSIVLVVIAGGVIAAGQYLAVHTPGKGDDQYADLITVDAPTVTRARGQSTEELVDYPGVGTPKPNNPANPNPTPNNPRPTPKPRNPGEPKPKPGEEDPDGMALGQVDQEGINDVVKRHQKGLFPCLVKLNKPGVMTHVPIEFTVAQGKVTKIWIDNPDLKHDTDLQECLLGQLKKWPFKEAQSASVSLSFNIGKKG